MPRRKDSRNTQPETVGRIKMAIKAYPDYSAARLRILLMSNYAKYGLDKNDIPRIRKLQQIKREWDKPATPQAVKVKKEIENMGQPWHLGLMGRYKNLITIEAVPHIFSVQKQYEGNYLELLSAVAAEVDRRKLDKEEFGPAGNIPTDFVSIRQAIWISRLFRIILNSELPNISWAYTRLEEESILSGEKEFNTINWDRACRNGKFWVQFKEMFYDSLDNHPKEQLGDPAPDIFDRE
jgi:hypothetical protein